MLSRCALGARKRHAAKCCKGECYGFQCWLPVVNLDLCWSRSEHITHVDWLRDDDDVSLRNDCAKQRRRRPLGLWLDTKGAIDALRNVLKRLLSVLHGDPL
jgi:hypothetical protein